MHVLLGGIPQTMLDGSSVSITRAMSDPVPTCTLMLVDNTSSMLVQAMQELIVIDENTIANPTINLLLAPDLNPYTFSLPGETPWSASAASGITVAQIPGGGAKFTFTNVAVGASFLLEQAFIPVIAGQSYTFSGTIQGSSTPTNFGVNLKIAWQDSSFNVLSTVTQTGAVPLPTTLTRYAFTATAPVNAAVATVLFEYNVTNSNNSGAASITQAQFEPNWFPTNQSYPTPFCGPSQTNCVQLPYNLLWIRQSRKFGGFVTHAMPQDYHGNVRRIQVDAVGYAWLLSTIIVNNSYTNQTDSFIIGDLISKYLQTSGIDTINILTTTNVVTGVTLSDFGANWDDIRTLFDNLASISGFYWTVDPYWNLIYAPPGYITMPISLICDTSSIPDNVTTFPAYNFSAEMDYTQPGSSILVIGSGSNVALVVDPNVPAKNAGVAGYHYTNWYQLPVTNIFMRKVNDSTLQSVTDCTNRGMAELLQYDSPRNLYHLTANQELIPGEGIAVTSNTDGLNQTVLLIQQVTATWIGTSETRNDVWEYQADLGATNRHVTNILSRLFRIANKNTSAPSISSTTLAVVESVAITDTVDSNSLYAETVLADSPIAYYRLGEPAGFSITTAYDWGGSAFNGTISGGVTLGEPGAIFNDPNTAMLFDGSSGGIALPSGLNPSGWTSVTVEYWFNCTSITGLKRILSNSGTSGTNQGIDSGLNTNAMTLFFFLGNGTTFGNTGTGALNLNQWYHIVGTWDGTTMRLYVNAVQVSSASLSGSIAAASASLFLANRSGISFYPGLLDEVAIYQNKALSQARITAHYNVGTLGHA